VKHGTLLIGGLGGTLWYNGNGNQHSNFIMRLKILTMLPRLLFNRIFHGRFIDILVTHAAPFGVGDRDDPCHRGFKAFLWFMRAFKPRYLLHGHIHLYEMNAERVHLFHETRVINVYDHYVLETETT
jgi:Icc-related predicted phosphoesterase